MDQRTRKALLDLRSFCSRWSDRSPDGDGPLGDLARALDDLLAALASPAGASGADIPTGLPGTDDLTADDLPAALSSVPGLRAMYMSPDMHIRWCSSALASIARVQGKDLRGRRCYRAVHGRTTLCPECPVLVALERRQPREKQMTWNEFEPQMLHADPLMGAGGRVEGVLVVAVDPAVEPAQAVAALAVRGLVPRRAAGQGVNVVSADLNLMAVAPENAGYMGRETAELLGRKCYREIAGRDDVCPGCPGVRTLATGLTAESETEGRRPDGSRFFALIQTEPVFDPDEKVIGFTEVVSDITDAVFLRQIGRFGERGTAAVERAPLPKMLEQVLDAVLELDGFTGGAAYLAFEEPGEVRLVGQRNVPADLLASLRRTSRPGGNDAGFATTKGGESVFVVPVREGDRLVAELRLVPAVPGAAAPTIVQALVLCRGQLAARFAGERAERECQEAAGLAAALIGSFPYPVWCVDESNRIIRWNPAAAQVFGWTESEVLRGRPPLAVPDSPEWSGVFEIRSGRRAVHGYELPCLRKDGSVVRLKTTIVPAHELRPSGVAGMFIVETTDKEIPVGGKVEPYAGK